MSEDLVKQAELRYQRRPVGHRQTQNEEIIPLKNNSALKPLPQACPDSKQSLPPIRHHGNQDISVAISNLSQLKTDDRPRTPRRRLGTPANQDLGGIDDLQPKRTCLPFVRCKINGKEIKSLLNTASPVSSINRRVHELCSLPIVQSTVLCIILGEDTIKVPVQLEEMGGHDLVFGMDFIADNNAQTYWFLYTKQSHANVVSEVVDTLSRNNKVHCIRPEVIKLITQCVLDFKQRLMTYNGSKSTPFLAEDEIPLKYRNKPTLTASM